MQRTVVLRPVLLLLVSVSLMASEPINRDATVKQYCLPCHSLKVKSGSLTLEGLSAGNPAEHPDVWEKVVRKLKAGEMPPPKMPRPDAATLTALTAALTAEMDAAGRRWPYA